ncbi:hypothetical protein EST38_g13535 [Candolleomyces aberdarensis]|uniref:Uncharacterized protein n=1 Tax=Candolleomyces aberdarensis TaxID=2316362 RepID=A0A4Q2D0H0_9AGAR|nr:hypothetical protein EST38_g13535 [Candolleomyces aberdarensis]
MPSPTIPTKRSRTASSTPSLIQLDKKTKRAGVVEVLTEALEQSGQEILKYLPYLCQVFSRNQEQMAILQRWYRFLTLPLDQQLSYTRDEAKELLERPNINPASHEVHIILMKPEFGKYEDLYHLVHEAHKPSPSFFSRRTIWPIEQQRNPILCLRPSTHTGLPLGVMYEGFRTFQLDAANSTPNPPARQAAALLCRIMGQPYASEALRSIAIDEALKCLIRQAWNTEYTVMADNPSESFARIDRALLNGSIPVLFREDKNESTSTESDVYMQVCWDYSFYIRKLIRYRGEGKLELSREERAFLDAGAPMFLMCIQGPSMFIAGGFYDGKTIIVEPLIRPLWLLKDCGSGRERDVAAALSALWDGVQGLRGLYDSEGEIADPPKLSFNKPLDMCQVPGVPGAVIDNPIFLGTLTIKPKSPHPHKVDVIIKLVNGHYGVDVHRALAKVGLAPLLLGISSLEGVPHAYVIEYLCPSEWVMLSELENLLLLGHKQAIYNALESIIDVLQKGKYVHGDLRESNIMINQARLKQEGRVSIKLIDFDWSGTAGEVFYPVLLNPEITWPGIAGGPISLEDDLKLLKSWWDE